MFWIIQGTVLNQIVWDDVSLMWRNFLTFLDLDKSYLCNWLKHGGVEAGVATARREGGKGGKVLDNLEKSFDKKCIFKKKC